MPMPGLPAKPLQFSDFSGGITDNILQGDPRRMETCDNFLITVDKKLEERRGIVPFDSVAPFAAPNLNVTGLYAAINETVLFAQLSRDMYVYDAFNHAWNQVPGIDGGQTLTGGGAKSQTSMAEFQRQLFVTDDGGDDQVGVYPIKMFRDTTNVWHSYSTGLPRAYANPTTTDAALLNSAIALANSLRLSFMSHFQDAVYSTYTQPPYVLNLNSNQSTYANTETGNPNFLHWNVDKWSLSYLSAQAFNPAIDVQPQPYAGIFGSTQLYRNGRGLIPPVVPVPVYACYDKPSLKQLVVALVNAYNHHTLDAIFGSVNDPTKDFPFYHYNIPNDGCINTITPINAEVNAQRSRGPLIPLQYNLTSDITADYVAALNELSQKWYFHRNSVATHSSSNDLTMMGRYAPSVGKILSATTDYKQAPLVTADFTDLYNFVNQMKQIFNWHVQDNNGTAGSANGVMHTQSDAFYQTVNQFNQLQIWRPQTINLPDCTDLDSMYLLIYWLRAMYYQHQVDSNMAFDTVITMTLTNGSAAATGVTEVGSRTSTTFGVETDRWLYDIAAIFSNINGSNSPNRDFTGASSVARIKAAGGGTITLDRPALITGTVTMNCTRSKQHAFNTVIDNIYSYGYTPAATASAPALAADTLPSAQSVFGTDTATWLALAIEFFNSFASHGTDLPIHVGLGHGIFASLFRNLNTQFQVPKISTLAYAFYFSHDYVVEPNGIEYLVQGNPVFTNSLQLATSYPVGTTLVSTNATVYPNAAVGIPRANVITRLPVLTNTADSNYDVANVKLQIYRTTDGGVTFYMLDSVANGTATYTDTTSDTLSPPGQTPLNTRQVIYTAGGVVGYDQPPQAKFIHALNGIMYYAGITDTGQFFPNRLRHSVQYSPDAAPATFYDDFDDEITGLSSTRSNLIVFCKNSVYRESGAFNSLGQGSLTHDNISDTLGCLNSRSIVRTEIGVFFAGNDGFYYTDGYQIIKISLELDKTYASLTASANQRRAIFGAYDKLTRRIWWTMRDAPTEDASQVTYVFYLDFGVKPSGTFTRVTGYNYSPSALVFQQGLPIFGQANGYVLKIDPFTKYDAVIQVGVAPSQWLRAYVPYHYRSTAVDFGTNFQRKWVTKFHVLGKNTGNMMIQASAVRDLNSNGNGILPMSEINYTENERWGAPSKLWETATDIWRYDGKMDVMRRFPDKLMRSDFMQVDIKPANGVVYASQNPEWQPYTQATIVSVAPTGNGDQFIQISLSNGAKTFMWPIDVAGMQLVLAWDGYVTQFTVVSVAGNLVTVHDSAINYNGGTNKVYDWMILGVKNEQSVTITSFVIHYSYLGDQVEDYSGAQLANGPGNSGGNT